MPDLFSQFDPSLSSFFKISTFGFWLLSLFLFIPISSSFFVSGSRLKVVFGLLSSPIVSMVKENKAKYMQGVVNYLVGFFFTILFINFSGMMPWTFSGSSQFLLTMAFAIPSWVCIMMCSGSMLPLAKVGEYVGTSIPSSLAPAIGLCEVISGLIRPLTLGLRLGANMLAGHVITSLVLNSFVFMFNSGSFWISVLSFISVGLYLFEMAVCFIQAYVFVLLLSIYVQEFPVSH